MHSKVNAMGGEHLVKMLVIYFMWNLIHGYGTFGDLMDDVVDKQTKKTCHAVFSSSDFLRCGT